MGRILVNCLVNFDCQHPCGIVLTCKIFNICWIKYIFATQNDERELSAPELPNS